MKAKITYLDNSGFAVELPDHFFVFDYMNNSALPGKKGLCGGVIDEGALKGKNVFVFVSHIHADHYNRSIFKWGGMAERIHYILSHDIQPVPNAIMAEPGKSYEVEDVRVGVLRSTDEGVAFVVKAEGHTVYHAGDLNWWHWEGEDPKWNEDMAAAYKKQINKLKDITLDIAFVPVDPRLQGSLLLGLDYLMNTARVKHAIPMHYGSRGDVVARAIGFSSLKGRKYKKLVQPPMKRGESVDVNLSV
ncbi:MAG TPA: hypothetical protein DEB31_10275 [Clostridiales bacterium]|nr:hypothetical protein [Clostridiales bacterium]